MIIRGYLFALSNIFIRSIYNKDKVQAKVTIIVITVPVDANMKLYKPSCFSGV